MKTIFLFLLLSANVHGTPLDLKCPEFNKFGAPISSIKNTEFICHTGFSLEYDKSAKITLYVNQHLKKGAFDDTYNRQNDFRVDPLQTKSTRVIPKDYQKSGYDQGHLAPADDFTSNKELLSESFLMSNMHPQIPSFNRGLWRKVENRARKLALLHGEVYVTTGTIYSKFSKKIGTHLDVTVPEATYKIIYIPKTESFESYLVPNVKYKGGVNMMVFRKSIKEIEKLSNIKFFKDK